jgi:exodeoxyribonuclease VII large subunit
MASAAERRVGEARQALEARVRRLERASRTRLERARGRLEAQRASLGRWHPQARLLASRVRQIRAHGRLQAAMRAQLGRCREEATVASERLKLLSPVGSLDRGWALVRRQSGSIVRQVTELAAGEELSILMRDGSFLARVESTAPKTREDS